MRYKKAPALACLLYYTNSTSLPVVLHGIAKPKEAIDGTVCNICIATQCKYSEHSAGSVAQCYLASGASDVIPNIKDVVQDAAQGQYPIVQWHQG
jgi:hypothetical protein